MGDDRRAMALLSQRCGDCGTSRDLPSHLGSRCVALDTQILVLWAKRTLVYYHKIAGECNQTEEWVTSSCLCEKSEGAVFPSFVKPVKDGVDDAIHARHIHKADHGSGATADLHKAALNDIGGA